MSKHCLNCNTLLTSRKSKIYCSNKCQALYTYKTYITNWLAGTETGQKSEGELSSHIRRWFHENQQSKCSKCGWDEINPTTKKCPLTFNHIDGNWSNHSYKNIELICPNCHSLTHNYGSLNKGKGRKQRLKKLKLPLSQLS